MEAKNADLSALRIDRAADPAAPTPGVRRWLVIGLPVAGVVVLAAVLLATSGALGSAVPVRLTPATLASPLRSRAGPVARGYAVAQRQAPPASKGTGRAARRERLLQERRGHGRRPAVPPGRSRRGRVEPRGRQPRPAVRDRAGRVPRRALSGLCRDDRADGGPRQSNGAGQGRLPLL